MGRRPAPRVATMAIATGVGSLPGDDERGVRRGGADRARRAAGPAAPARAARPRGRRDHDRPGAGDRERPRRRPAAGRVAAHRRARASTTAGRAACSPRTSTRSRSRRRSTSGVVQGPGRRARGRWRPRSRSRAATRCSATSAPAASWPRRWPRGSGPTSPTYAAGCAGSDRLVVQVDEPALAAVLTGSVPTASGFHRHRSRRPARGLGRPGLGPRGDHRRGRRAVGAHVRRATPRSTCSAAPARAGSRSTWR